MHDRGFFVYILASRSRSLYTGVTNNLFRRVMEHKRGMVPGFTLRHRISRLVYMEGFCYVREAIAREKRIKAWTRAKRVASIEEKNPGWYDLAEAWYDAKKRNADSSGFVRLAKSGATGDQRALAMASKNEGRIWRKLSLICL